MARLVVDLSSYQGAADLVQAKRFMPDLAGVIIKAIEGRWPSTNPYFEQQYASARAAGLPVGFYCFDHTSVDALYESDLYLAKIAGRPAELGHWFDFEANDGGLSQGAVQAHVATWLHEVNQERPETVGVYTAPWAWEPMTGYMDATAHPLWLAGYTEALPASPVHWGSPPLMWQFTDRYRFSFGACDASLFLGTDQQWAALTGGSNPLEDDMTPQQDALLKEIGSTVMTIASRQQQQANIIIHGKSSPTDKTHWGLDQTGQALRQLLGAKS